MYPSKCKSVHAQSLEQATELMEKHGTDAHVLAGGQSLVPLMKQRLANPEILIDISHLEPDPITKTDDSIEVSALTKHGTVGSNHLITDSFDVIADAIPQIGDYQIRNMGTVGGALAEADPGNDWGPIMIATNGSIHTVSPDGGQTYDAEPFFEAPFTTKLSHDELIQSVSIPIPEGNVGGAYIKAKRRQGGYGTAAIGMQCTVDHDGNYTSLNIAAIDDSETYVTPTDVEEMVPGNQLTDDLLDRSADELETYLNPIDDNLGSAAYKTNLGKSIYKRALKVSYCRARGRAVPNPKKVNEVWSEIDVEN